MSTILKVDDINVYYGSIHAIKGISFHVEEGEIVTLIGANGAGKSTTLNTISGLLRSRTGSITLNDKPIDHIPPHKVVEHGLAMCPEGRRIFLQMTVEENLEMGGGLGIDGVVVILDFTGTLRGCCCGRDLSLVLYPTFYCLHGAAPPVGKGRNGQCGRKNCPNNRNVAQNPEHGRSYRIPCNFFRAVSLTALLKVMAFWWYGLIRASTIKGGSQAQCLWT